MKTNFAMDIQNKTKEELIKELQELQYENNSLKALYDKDITNRKRTEEALRESEEKYRVLFGESTLGILATDVETHRLLYSNPAICRMFGYSDEEFLRLTIPDLHPKDSMDLVISEFESLMRGEKVISSALPCLRKDGTVFYADISNSSTIINGRKCAVGFIVDVTMRKQAKDALRESELKFRNYIDFAPHGIFVVDEMGNYVDVNPAASSITGYSKDELLSMKLFELIPEESMEFSARHFEKVVRDGFATGEFPFIKKDRSIGYWSVEAVKLSDQRFLGFVVDVTMRKQAEDALEQANSELQNLHNNLDLAVFSVDVIHNKMLQISIAHEAVFGYSQEAFFNNPMLWYEIIVPEDKLIVDASYPVLFSGKNLYHEFRIVHADGQIRWIEAKIKPTLDTNGKLIRIDGIASNITERKRLEETLRESEVKYQEIFEFTGTATFIFDENAITLMANNECYSITGYTPTEMIGQKLNQYFAPESLPEIMKNHKLRSQNPDLAPKKYEVKLVNKKGEKRDVIINVGMISDTKQRIVSILDITDRKRAEEALDQERVLLRTIIDNFPNSILVKDKKYRKIVVNLEHARRVTAHLSPAIPFSADDLLGKTDFEVYPRELAEKFLIEDQKVIEGGRSVLDQELLSIDANGQSHWELISKIPLRDRNGEIIGLVVISNDITERKQAEETLRESEERFRKIFEESQVGIVIVTLGYRFEKANPAFCSMMGYTTNELNSMTFVDITHPDHIGKDIENMKRLELGEIPFYGTEKRYLCKTGEIRWGNLTISGIRNNDGTQLYYLGMINDITERKRAELELIIANKELVFQNELKEKRAVELVDAKDKAEASDRLKTAFMNNISHEIRTPLNGILGFAPFIIQPDITMEEKEKYLEILNLSSERLMNTVTDIMDISLIISGNMEMHPQPIDISLLLMNVFENFQEPSMKKNLELKIQFPDNADSFILNTDREMLQKTICKLVDNSVKFTKAGSITLGFELINNEIEIFVKDTGEGIEKDSQERIFESFMQENTSNIRGHEGSGLGLSIAKGVMQLLGGEIRLESTKNVGTTVFLTLPNITSTVFSKPKNLKNAIKAEGMPIILIAEDDDSNYSYIETLLSKGSKTLRACNGQEAVDLCKKHPDINLVLMDIKMPVMNGIEATQIIKSFRNDLPIIAVTAHAQSGDEFKIKEAGCDDYISKPINKTKLFSLIQKYFNK